MKNSHKYLFSFFTLMAALLAVLTFGQQLTFAQSPQVMASDLVAKVLPFGEVERLKQIIIKFDKPVAQSGSISVEQAHDYVSVEPELNGQWTFKDSQTLVLVPADGTVKMATTYRVTVKGGVKSEDGASTSKEQVTAISTAPARPYQFFPDVKEVVGVQPRMVAKYNQKIDSNAVSKFVKLQSGLRTYPLRFLSEQEYLSGPPVQGASVSAGSSDWIAFEPVDKLTIGSRAVVTFASGCPSLAGPDLSRRARQYDLIVQSPLSVLQTPANEVSPVDGAGLRFTFNNQLQTTGSAKSYFVFDPPLADFDCHVTGKTADIDAKLLENTDYTVTLKPGLLDIFGQSLTQPVIVKFKTKRLLPRFIKPKELVTIPSGAPAFVQFESEGQPQVKVSVFRVDRNDFEDYFASAARYEKLLSKKPVASHMEQCGLGRSTIKVDLTPYLNDGLGQFVVLLSADPGANPRDNLVFSWVQITGLSVDVFTQRQSVAYVSDIHTGQPQSNVILRQFGCPIKIGITDQDGLARLKFVAPGTRLIAEKDGDLAIVDNSSRIGNWRPESAQVKSTWWMVSDKTSYLPGDTVFVKGLLREVQQKNGVSVCNIGEFQQLEYKVTGEAKSAIKKGEVNLDRYGAFDFKFKLPEHVSNGVLAITVSKPGEFDTDEQQLKYNTIYRFSGFHKDADSNRHEIFVVVKEPHALPVVSREEHERELKIMPMQFAQVGDSAVTWQVGQLATPRVSVVGPLGVTLSGVPFTAQLRKVVDNAPDQLVDSKSGVSKSTPIPVSFTPLQEGLHRFVVSFNADGLNPVEYIHNVVVAGANTKISKDHLPALEIQLDKSVYTPGENARIRVKSPLVPANGLLIASCQGIVDVKPIVIRDGSADINLTLPVASTSRILLTAYLTNGTNSLTAQESVSLRNTSKELNLSISPPKTTSGNIEFNLKTAKGQPVKFAQISMLLFRESKDSTPPPVWPDIIQKFMPALPAPLDIQHNFNVAPLAAPRFVEFDSHLRVTKTGWHQSEVVRFEPSVITDDNGRAVIKVNLPENNCQYFIRAIAVSGDDSFVMTESKFSVGKP